MIMEIEYIREILRIVSILSVVSVCVNSSITSKQWIITGTDPASLTATASPIVSVETSSWIMCLGIAHGVTPSAGVACFETSVCQIWDLQTAYDMTLYPDISISASFCKVSFKGSWKYKFMIAGLQKRHREISHKFC